MKYAGIEVITVRLFEELGYLNLTVLDNGIGFDINSQTSIGTGLGLYGMRNVLNLVDGQLSIRARNWERDSCLFENTTYNWVEEGEKQ